MSGKNEQPYQRRARGPERAGVLLASRIRTAGESRGFAVSRLLTHWAEIVGAEIAAVARPVEISYGKGFGGTLTILVPGAHAPMIEMQKERIRDRVNACYGYSAISRVRITQTSPQGFGAPKTEYDHAPAAPSPDVTEKAHRAVGGVSDTSLREALEALGRNVLTKKST